jgi:cell division protein FtsI (penicillin-binding protein 3)
MNIAPDNLPTEEQQTANAASGKGGRT